MASIDEISNIFLSNFSLAEGLDLLIPISLFVVGMAIYAFFIFKFYRFVAKRDIFEFNLKKYENSKHSGMMKFLHSCGYFVKYVLFLPILTFFWFIVLSVILAFLSKQDNLQSILLVSISLVSVIRIMAYYDEDLSKDLAKMLPFALLGVFLVDISYFSVSNSLDTILQFGAYWKIVVYYLAIIILLEFVLRILYFILSPFRKEKKEE